MDINTKDSNTKRYPEDICAHCKGTRIDHHGYECCCNALVLSAYWDPLEALPSYIETRETVLEWERNAPKPCDCRSFQESIE